ncbi:ABC transporter permease subunit [Streptomyces sp. KA12]|uniref:ABC transporter permease n=1 Tax=Streptomyces sp. KA12 TaxID=2991730 RepID=UPI0023AFFD94|nr:ABC transporter permease subunit [Streptomyces sp. KA12]MDF0376242.1 ABC transporter permease subunit [Streptomyces sp. KA12]
MTTSAPADTAAKHSAAIRARPRRARLLLRAAPAGLLVLLALAGPLLAPHATDIPLAFPYAAPGDSAALGGDVLGRDVLSRVLAGGAPLIATALGIAVAVTSVATILGIIAALRPALGRWIERAADLAILLPAVLGIMLIALAWPGGGRLAIGAAATVLGIPYAVRIVAAAAEPIATTGYVEAAAAGGERLWHLAVHEVLPNLRATLLALFGLRFVEGVYVVSVAAFLQLGPQPPEADWALMIRENTAGITLNPWAVAAPCLAIGLLAVSVNLAAEALAPARHTPETPL